jgi:hypothetical protein
MHARTQQVTLYIRYVTQLQGMTSFIGSIQKEQGVCHNVALPFTLKKYLKAKEEL